MRTFLKWLNQSELCEVKSSQLKRENFVMWSLIIWLQSNMTLIWHFEIWLMMKWKFHIIFTAFIRNERWIENSLTMHVKSLKNICMMFFISKKFSSIAMIFWIKRSNWFSLKNVYIFNANECWLNKNGLIMLVSTHVCCCNAWSLMWLNHDMHF